MWSGSFIYDKGGFERALELLASDGFPNELLIEAEDVPLDGLSDALVGLAEGRYRRQGDGGPPAVRRGPAAQAAGGGAS